MISVPDRKNAVTLIDEAYVSGARRAMACVTLGISLRTYRRWTVGTQIKTDGRPDAVKRPPANQLDPIERESILAVCNEPRFHNLPPSQIVPTLADQGRYIGSESTFYRVLTQANQLAHRGRAKSASKPAKPDGFVAEAANQIWSWDITFLASTVTGVFFRLYLIMDIFSRKIVGWEVHDNELASHASMLIEKACLAESVRSDQLVLHSDNGSPMKGATMLATLQRLGVVPSFSRPSVSNDNPYSESLFRTLKYVPSYPSTPFETIDDARKWVLEFVQWYNHQHRHSALNFVTPAQRHNGEEEQLLAQRHRVYEAAKARHPERWSGDTRNWSPASAVHLNPDQPALTNADSLGKAA